MMLSLNCGRLYAGVPRMLEQLHLAGHQLSICSNGSLQYIDLVLKSMGISGYFENRYSAKLSTSKAEFLKIVLNQKESSVFIGDSEEDVQAAQLNQLPSIAAAYGYGERAGMYRATFLASTPNEILFYINQIGVFQAITEKLVESCKRIIGISGVDTSGKSVFTENYARYLKDVGYKSAVIHIDDFHNPLRLRRSGKDEVDAYYTNAFNYGMLINTVLKPYKENGQIDRAVYCLNLDTDEYDTVRHYSFDSDTIILIEGVLLFRPPLLDYLDGTVFLEINFQEMLKRASERDVPKYGEIIMEKYRNKYIPVQKRYIDEYKPQVQSDIIIDNNDYFYPIIQ